MGLRGYNVTDLQRIKDIEAFVKRNLDNVAIGVNEAVNVLGAVRNSLVKLRTDVENDALKAYTSTTRPSSTKNTNVIIINTTTNKLNHTRDGGTTWYNADGTAA